MSLSVETRASASAKLSNIGEWPRSGIWILYCVCIPLVIIEFTDTLLTTLIRHSEGSTMARLVVLANYLPSLFFAIWAFFLGRRMLPGIYLAFFGLALNLIVVCQFKGDFLRPGTFDLFEESQRFWLLPMLTGTCIGSVAGVAYALFRRRDAVQPKGLVAQIITCVSLAAVADSFRAELMNPSTSWSAFAPTRHWALLALTVGAAATYAVSRVSEKQNAKS